MPGFMVELTGLCREVYFVEAETAEEAEANWMDGSLYRSEASTMEVIDVRQDED